MGCADAKAVDGRRGSNIYEVNQWLWQFGRGKPRLGGLSVEDTQLEERKAAATSLLALNGTCVQLRLVGGARQI